MKKRLFKYLKPYKAEFIFASIAMVLFGATDGGIPFLIKQILDRVFKEQNSSLLYIVVAALLVFAIFRAGMDFLQQFLMSKIGHLIVRDMRDEVAAHLLKLSPNYFITNQSAQIVARVTSDVALIRGLLTETVAALVRDSIRVVALLGAALYLDPVLALLSVVVFPLGVYPVMRIAKRMRKLSKKGQEGIGSLSVVLQETILGNRVVKIFQQERFEEERFREQNDRNTKVFIKSEVARALTGPLNEVLAMAAISSVILYGGYTVINGFRTQGDFIAFLISVFLMYEPIKKLSKMHTGMQQGFAGAERVFEILDSKPEVETTTSPVPFPKSDNTIHFKTVSFAYGTAADPSLRAISLTIPAGKKVAVVGFSGAGKSTLIDLLPRFIDPTSGTISIGGVDIQSLSLSELRANIALVGQHTFLFNATIRENIAYGKIGATEQEIEDAARSAYAYDFIMELPEKFNTLVGEGGFTLSGGERQRIAIARAILKNAPILILDEATASLDNRSEREVQKALEKLAEGKTSIVIAHRLSTIQDADKIVVMQDGEIVETGTHEELLKKSGGAYEKLYALQFRSQSTSAD